MQGLRPFGNTLPRGLKGILKKNGYNYSEIIIKWNKLVGNNISDHCYPKSIKMTRGDKNGILFFRCSLIKLLNQEFFLQNC